MVEVTLNIKEAANIVGVTPATLRNWEKYGFYTAKRKDNGYRYYEPSDIEVLMMIKEHMIDDRLNSKHVTKILSGHSGDKLYLSQAQTEKEAKSKMTVAQFSKDKWRSYRNKLGLTLEEVSTAVGISSSYLSKIENNQANVSLEVMTKLAHYYGESLVFFTNYDQEDQSLIRYGEEVKTDLGLIRTETMQLSNLKKRTMFPTLFEIKAGGKSPEAHSHNGEEFIYVLEGSIDVYLNDDEKYVLNEKDSFSFKGTTKHYWQNSTNKTTVLLWVHSTF